MSRDLTDALSKLFIKLGGKLSDSKENKGPVDYIDDITGIVEPGGGSGGSDIFRIHYSIDYTDPDNLTATIDKTFSQIEQAVKENKLVIARNDIVGSLEPQTTADSYDIICIPNYAPGEDGEPELFCIKINDTSVDVLENGILVYNLRVFMYRDNTITVEEYTWDSSN